MVIVPKKEYKLEWNGVPRGKYILVYLLRLYSFTGLMLFYHESVAQCPGSHQIYDRLKLIEKDAVLPDKDKLARVFTLQKVFDRCTLNKDSVYAYILHRIGVLQYNAKKLNEAISNTQASIKINISLHKWSDQKFAVKSYYNVGYYYESLYRFTDALRYYDSCIAAGMHYSDSTTLLKVAEARNSRAHIYFQKGDYQKAVEEAALGLKITGLIKNSLTSIKLLNERAQAYAGVKQINEAERDVDKAFALITGNNYPAFANNYKIKAAIYEATGNYTQALAYHTKGIFTRTQSGDTFNLAGDYLDAGNTLRNETIHYKKMDFSRASAYYTKSLKLAQLTGNSYVATKASNNLSAINFRLQKYRAALDGYHSSLLQLTTAFKSNNALNNPTYRQCNAISDKNFLSLLLANKTECLLHLYKETSSEPYVAAALKTARLTDSLITDMRHEQTGDQSKLYWRAETREFFTNAIEACYAAKDFDQAFYFMEKSRAVLLNDQLNELGASAHLPVAEAMQEQKLQINVLSRQQQLAGLADTSRLYKDEEVKLFAAKEALNRYIKTLETKYPVYYQYKYADAVPTLPALKNYLAANKQSFLHYFINDTAVYILIVTPFSSAIIKQSARHLNIAIANFLQICADRLLLNNHYDSFTRQANHLYKTLFQRPALAPGRIIICTDAAMIPFEALATDINGNHFLIENYAFSYVYSARFLLHQFNNPAGSGSFLGVAPVTYAPYLSVSPLLQSGAYLNETSAYYPSNKVIVNREANRKNLLKQLPRFTVVAILSHARASNTDNEPLLFMSDSIVRLSELQQLRNPATELIVLSACETNVGRIASGEGIFSLARGFASAGIPSVTGTLWKADENATYTITKMFLEYVSKGMRKDDALQKAKLAFMLNGSTKNALPYYWANMILAGNALPVALHSNKSNRWLQGGLVLLAAMLLLTFIFRKKLIAGHKNYTNYRKQN